MRAASRFRPVPARRTSGGPATAARADRSPGRQALGGLRDRDQRPDQGTGQLVGDDAR